MGFILFIILCIIYGSAQFIAAYAGIDFLIGSGWAITAIVASSLFRFTLPITIGAFFGAMDVWHWHWFFAALFAAPGLVLIVPGVLMTIIEGGKKWVDI
jgi:hypothetical protein